MSNIQIDEALIADIETRLDLRRPNHEALLCVAMAVSEHYDVRKRKAPFEGVLDVATGVGKTYIMAGVMEYYSELGHRHFAVITPGSTILNKTLRNFTPGDEKSVLGGMSFRPELITSETFDSPSTALALEGEHAVNIYLFTVQSLIRPTSNQGRRTREFRENLGMAFYDRLAEMRELIVFADEHHTYYGPSFSKAVRGLNPYALLGLTATPHEKTPKEQIIFRYPLASAIADRYVKTPVIVGRRDNLDDDRTKLADGVRLLDMKSEAVERYVAESGDDPVNPVMLVIAQTIDDADEYTALLTGDDFFDGRFRGRVLTVHSDQSEAALADLARLEHPKSPVRIVVSVGMLKEGWDVKNVYVIASMRASVSEILTEQTLGRGLRLPFGRYTGIEMLDTLEVVAHERYEALLKRAKVLKEELVDHRTILARAGTGMKAGTQEVRPHVHVSGDGDGTGDSRPGYSHAESGDKPGGMTVAGLDEREAALGEQLQGLREDVHARDEMPEVLLPVVRTTPVTAKFSLADVEPAVFEKLGKQHAASPEGTLRRTVLSAESTDDEGTVRIVTRTAKDEVTASSQKVPLEESTEKLRRALLNSDVVPQRKDEADYLDDLIDAYVDGLADDAEDVLSSYPDRAAGAFATVLASEQRKLQAKPEMGEVIATHPLSRIRTGRPQTSKDLAGDFKRGVGYEGWRQSYFPQVWFDSTPEFRFARVVDDAKSVAFWVRLMRGDLRIKYTSSENRYSPDFLVVLEDGTHLLVEVKDAAKADDETVQKKRDAARRWTRRVSKEMEETWEYLLVTDEDIRECKGSWAVLRKAAS